jgi:osmotically-inducible protein OsmY
MNTLDDKRRAYHPVATGLVIWLLAVLMPIVAPGALDAAISHKAITDSGITLAVEGDLSIDEGVLPNFIDVSTSHGIVTLSGSVPDLLAKKRAVNIAESIRGVLAVVDRITVTPVSRPDEDLQKDVSTALHQDPATEFYKVDVSVKDAVVTLTGSVGSQPELQLVTWIAEGVKGVKDVRNDLKINYQTKRTDQEIAGDVNDRLQWDIWINGDPINVVVKNGQVTLTGMVGSAIEKTFALEDAWVNGVTSVDIRGLKVEPWLRDEARRKHRFVVKFDEQIKRAVQASFHYDPRVSPFSLDVTVKHGVTTFSGTVDNLKAKTAAEQDARDTVGVLEVDNLLKVRPKNLPINPDIEKNLQAALLRDPRLDGLHIEVAVINHAAYLGGWVDSAFQKSEAQDVASRTKGVVLVRDHLRIEPEYSLPRYSPSYSGYDWRNYKLEGLGPPPPKSDAQIKKDIEKAFFWSPFVDRDDITLTVHDGVAILRGTVDGYLAYSEADRDARKSDAIGVINRLNVKKSAWF